MISVISRTKSFGQTLALVDRLMHAREFAHVISLNTENAVLQMEDKKLRAAFMRAEVVIADGIGIRIGANVLGIPVGDRITGVDLMHTLVHRFKHKKILFLGGMPGSAEATLEYFVRSCPISNPNWKAVSHVDKDDTQLIETVLAFGPDLCFVAFGSPAQELWIERYRRRLVGVVCMGVGQGMDVYGGVVKRAPALLRRLGLEWLYRLINQPWRIGRQMRLVKFLIFIMRARLFGHDSLRHRSSI